MRWEPRKIPKKQRSYDPAVAEKINRRIENLDKSEQRLTRQQVKSAAELAAHEASIEVYRKGPLVAINEWRWALIKKNRLTRELDDVTKRLTTARDLLGMSKRDKASLEHVVPLRR